MSVDFCTSKGFPTDAARPRVVIKSSGDQNACAYICIRGEVTLNTHDFVIL